MKFGLFLILAMLMSSHAFAADLYPDYQTLAQNEKSGVDYRIVVEDKGSPTTLFAVHGGGIERGTSELVRAIDGGFNQYHFEGLKADNNFSMHITSARFDEPQALKLVARSRNCLSLHGYIGKGEDAVCIGGQNVQLASKIALKLKSLNENFEVIFPCPKYPGLHANNIVNRCQQAGAQLEMSSVFRDRLLENPTFKSTIAEALREVLANLP